MNGVRFQGFTIQSHEAWDKGLPGMGWYAKWHLRSQKTGIEKAIQRDPIIRILHTTLDKAGLDVSIAPYYDAMEGPYSSDTFLLTPHRKSVPYDAAKWATPNVAETVIASKPHEILTAAFLVGMKSLGAQLPFIKTLVPAKP